MAEYQLGVIGGGQMAEALLRSVVGRSVLNHNAIFVSEPVLSRRQMLLRDLQVSCGEDDRTAAACPYVLLAPSQGGEGISGLLDRIAGAVDPATVVISIAPGVSTAFLDERLGGRGRIVRASPNTPALVRAGVTPLAAGPRAEESDLHWAENLFAACGNVVRVSEEVIDAATAVAGAGPACFFYVIEAMIEAGVAEGLAPEVAAALAAETCAGAARLLTETHERPDVLRARETAPGTSARRAVESLDAADVKARLVDALRAAGRTGHTGT